MASGRGKLYGFGDVNYTVRVGGSIFTTDTKGTLLAYIYSDYHPHGNDGRGRQVAIVNAAGEFVRQDVYIPEGIRTCAHRDIHLAHKSRSINESRRVEADSLIEFLDKWYKHDRFRGRGEEYAAAIINSYTEMLAQYGYVWIGHYESRSGEEVSWFPKQCGEMSSPNFREKRRKSRRVE